MGSENTAFAARVMPPWRVALSRLQGRLIRFGRRYTKDVSKRVGRPSPTGAKDNG